MSKEESIKKIVEAMDGWLSFDEGKFLYGVARSLSRRGAVVEIGSWKGKSTIWLANGLRDGPGGKVYAIDPHTGAPEHHEIFKTKNIWTFNQFKKNIKAAGIESFVEPIVDRSENVAKTWNEPVKFLWIDGAHAYAAAKLDFDSWFPYLIEGGIIAYHDATYEDVKSVVKEKILYSLNFKNAGIIDTIIFATKISPQKQTFFDRLHNRYIIFLCFLHELRKIPMPNFLRRGARKFFKKFLRKIQ